MSPSGHTANLSDLDSLSGSRLHDAEEVNHTAFGPASEPCDEKRHLLGAQAWLRQTTLQTLQTVTYRYIEVCMSYRTMPCLLLTLTGCSAMRNKTLRYVGNPSGAKTRSSCTRLHTLTPLHQRKQMSCLTHRGKHLC